MIKILTSYSLEVNSFFYFRNLFLELYLLIEDTAEVITEKKNNFHRQPHSLLKSSPLPAEGYRES